MEGKIKLKESEYWTIDQKAVSAGLKGYQISYLALQRLGVHQHIRKNGPNECSKGQDILYFSPENG